MRTILITGCSSGIGLDAARTLSARGWRVFATCRAEADCARLRAEGLESVRLDYEDPGSIAAAIAELAGRSGGRLDALFNNGAYAIPGALEDIPAPALRAIFEANVIGWHDLTRRAIPLLRASGRGRIVQCSSVLGYVGLKWRGAYVASKFALEGMTDVLRLELAETDGTLPRIDVVLIEPGPIATPFRQNAIRQFERWVDWQASARAPQYRARLLKRLYESRGSDRFELPPAAVTAALTRALEARRPRARYRVTRAAQAMAVLRRLLPDRLLDAVLRRG